MEQPISQALGDHLPWLIRISQRVCGWINEPELCGLTLLLALVNFRGRRLKTGLRVYEKMRSPA